MKKNTKQPAATGGCSAPTACSAPKYRIEKVQDFLKVPPDRLEECLTEFRDYLKAARSITEAAKVIGEVVGAKSTDVGVGPYNWCDDSIRKGTINFTVVEEQNARTELTRPAQ